MPPCYLLSNLAPGKWTPLAHTYEDLESRLRRDLENFHNSRRQRLLVDTWFASRLHEMDEILAKSYPEDIALIQIYFDAFNSIFFFDALTPNHCPWRLLMSSENEWRETHPFYRGFTMDWRPALNSMDSDRESIITPITVLEQPGISNASERFRGYVAVLLHEMLHAVFNTYTCFCRAQCCRRAAITRGYSGHGPPWRRVAFVVQKFVREQLDLHLDIGRAIGMASELDAFQYIFWTMPDEGLHLLPRDSSSGSNDRQCCEGDDLGEDKSSPEEDELNFAEDSFHEEVLEMTRPEK